MESLLCAWLWAKPFPCVSLARLHSALSNKYYCFSQIQIRKQILEEVGNWPRITHLMGWGLWLELWQTWLESPVLTSWATLVLAAFSELVLQILENGRTYCLKTIFFFFLQEASIFLYLTFTNLTQSILTCRLKVLSFSTSWVCWKISSLSLESKYEIIIYFSLDLLAFLLLKIPWEQWGLLWE